MVDSLMDFEEYLRSDKVRAQREALYEGAMA
jgi:hypothetical protein